VAVEARSFEPAQFAKAFFEPFGQINRFKSSDNGIGILTLILRLCQIVRRRITKDENENAALEIK